MNTGDLTTLANAMEWLGLTGLVISDISLTDPAVVTLQTRPTTTALINGLRYTLIGTGTMGLDDEYVVTVLTPTTFSIPVDATALAAYVGGAYVEVSQPLVQRLISSCSAFIQNWMNRTVASTTYTQTFNGQDMPTMMLPEYPVTAIGGVAVDGLALSARPALTYPATYSNGSGYTFQETGQLALSGYLFTRGYNNVTVTWDAGYLKADEAHTVPATAPYTVDTDHWNAGDRGVTYADGTALVKVTSAPAQGEYSVADSVYTFAAADASAAVLISYGIVPYDIEQACIDTLGDWFKYRERIGTLSKSIEGQSVSYTNFTNTGLPSRAKDVLMQYRKVFPS